MRRQGKSARARLMFDLCRAQGYVVREFFDNPPGVLLVHPGGYKALFMGKSIVDHAHSLAHTGHSRENSQLKGNLQDG